MGIPELEHESGSWIVVDSSGLSGSWIVVDSSGKAQCELFERKNVEQVIKNYPFLKVMTALEYLSSLNDRSKR